MQKKFLLLLHTILLPNGKETKMCEITRNHEDALDYYMSERMAYPNAVYDFTFENRYLIYHAPMRNELAYIALDMKTGLSSEICSTKHGEIPSYEFEEMIPQILYSIKYNGDKRFVYGYQKPLVDLIDKIFREVLPQHDFAVREEQIQLCKKMYNGLLHKKAAICEAEVGTGKSLAYLVAGFCAKMQTGSNEAVTISTSSIELQNALIDKEIPRLSRILLESHIAKRPITAVLRKGKEHYFCPFRFEDYVNKLRANPQKHGELLYYFDKSHFEARAFDLDKIAIQGRIKSKICVKGHCTECDHSASCRYNLFTRNAMSASVPLDFQVTNHNLYLTSAKQSGLLRESSFVIIDEAHKLKEAAQSVFGERFSEGTIKKYLNWTSTHCISTEMLPLYRQTRTEIKRLNKELFLKLRSMIPADDASGENNIITLDIECKSFIESLFDAISDLEEIRKDIRGMSEVNGNRIRNCLHRFIEDSDLNVWLETEDNGEITLCCCSKNIGNSLRKNVWRLKRSHVFTSGTMSDGVNFDFFKQEHGLDRIANNEMIEYSNPSPFDYKNHTRLYLPSDLPTPDNDNDFYVKAVADRIVDLVNATNGHTAILFTSYKLLSKVYELTKKRLSKYNVIRMTKSDRTAISEFKKSKNGVLFASGSMWEGVDCVGNCLSSVIIVRLPFPLRTATMNEKKANSASVEEFIHKYAVPEMLIKLRQGVGRLVRCETDTGILAILDCRATYGSYADNVKHTLRKYPVIESIDEVERFIKAIKDKSYFE